MCYCREVIKEYTTDLSLPLLKTKSKYTRLVSAQTSGVYAFC